jgi:hypothetical protein
METPPSFTYFGKVILHLILIMLLSINEVLWYFEFFTTKRQKDYNEEETHGSSPVSLQLGYYHIITANSNPISTLTLLPSTKCNQPNCGFKSGELVLFVGQ